jgi:hypothetical protein
VTSVSKELLHKHCGDGCQVIDHHVEHFMVEIKSKKKKTNIFSNAQINNLIIYLEENKRSKQCRMVSDH